MASYDFLNGTGIIVADTGDTQATVEAEFKAAFGDDLVTDPATPQGALITAEVLARDNTLRNNAVVANQINPNVAGGVFLDAIWALTGGGRTRANSSIIPAVNMTGVPGVTVLAGALASVGVGGPQFASTADVTFAPDGTAATSFISLDLGPVPAAIGALDTIASGVLGWETVTNPTAAIPGLSDEGDGRSRGRRRNTLALQGVGLMEAIRSNLYDPAQVPGLRSAATVENETSADRVMKGVNVLKNSIFVCADGGTNIDVATAMVRKKSLGCNWTGTVVVDVTHPATGQVYHVKFDRPTPVPIFMIVTVKAGSAVADPQETVRKAIVDYAAGLIDGEIGLTVASDVSAFEIGAAINDEAIGLFVTNVLIGTAPAPVTSDLIVINNDQIAQVVEGNIAVNVV